MAKHAENGRSANDARKNGVAIRINYETGAPRVFIPRVYIFAIFYWASPSRRENRPSVEPGNEAIVWKRGRDIFPARRRGEKCYVAATKNGSTAKGIPLPFTDSCSRAFIKLASTSTYTSLVRVLLMFRVGEMERSKDRGAL